MLEQLIQVKGERNLNVHGYSGANPVRFLEAAASRGNEEVGCEGMLRDTLLKNWCRGSRLFEKWAR